MSPAASFLRVLAMTALMSPALLEGQSRPAPPTAARIPKVDTLHGNVLVDEYAWFRDRTNPSVIAHLDAENRYTESMTAGTAPLRDALYAELVGRIKETDLGVPTYDAPYWYYSRTVQGQPYPIYCRKLQTLDAAEEVIFDQNAEAKGRKFFSLGAFEVSPDHRLLALLVDTTGYEDFTLRVKDLRTGKYLPDRKEKLGFGLAWASDNRTLFYMSTDSAKRADRVWRHTLGGTVRNDVAVFHEPDVLFNVSVERMRSGEFIAITSGSFTQGEVRVIDAVNPSRPARLIAARRPNVEYDIEHGNGHFWITTNDGAPNFKVARVRDDAADLSKWEDWVAPRADVFVEDVTVFRDFAVVSERREGLRRLRVTTLATGAAHDIAFPEAAYAVSLASNPMFDAKALRFSYSSLVTPSTVVDYDMGTRERTVRKQQEVLGGYDPTKYGVERRMAKARDGVMVPVSIVYRLPLVRDGKRPLLEYAYGSYGANTEPGFSSNRISLLDRGVIYAIAHIRGGQEMGRQWYDDGKMMKKKNTFTDFIDVGEFLVNEGYTSKDRMLANGGSAGGLLMGVVANMRPDLYKAIIAAVPFVDVINTMSDASIPLTAQEWEQWGNPAKADEYAYMRSYSPYENVEAKDYPAMLVTSGLNDSRVAYWEPTKWVARLREKKTDANPLLLRMNMGAGHGGSSGRYERLREIAFDYAFMLQQVGLDGKLVP
ncbi:MAG TPA: S9 family peptidase [Gemmatimonadaceae bacterium]|nr:S9 family peptidase [Gemmatimonadaceae bacterium]